MIKKILFSLIIFIWLWLSFSSAWKLQLVGLNSSPSLYDSNYDITFLKWWGLLSSYLWQWKSVMALKSDVFFWWTTDWQPYYYDHWYQWFFGQYWACDELTWDSIWPSNCTSTSITWDYRALFKWFFSKVKQYDYVFYDYERMDIWSSYYDNTIQVCWSSSELHKSLCFRQHSCYNWRGCSAYNYWSLINSQWLSNLSYWLLSNSWIWYAPWQNWYDWSWNEWWITYDPWTTYEIDPDLQNTIDYYERYFGWDINMCYVWTNNLSWVYGTPWINFEFWTGATIYGLYYSLYGTFWNNRIHNLWTFINTWLMAYWSWYSYYWEVYTNDYYDWIQYMPIYNWPDTNITLIYTWFSFPFADKPVAIFFMTDLLQDYIKEESQWENIIYYCDLKLNYEFYKNWTRDFRDTQNLVDPKILDRIKYNVNHDLWWQGWYSVPDLSWWSIWWNLYNSWYNIPSDLNPTNLFKDYYEKINWLVKNFRPVNDVWIIPWWILYPMIFLILFRILRH